MTNGAAITPSHSRPQIASTPTNASADLSLGNDAMSPLFQAAIEATEEAIINSLLKATTVTGNGRTVEALPIDKLKEILRKYGRPEK